MEVLNRTKSVPRVKLYHIQIFAWFKSDRVLFVQDDRAGLELEFDMVKFKAVDAIVDTITDKQMKKVTDKLDDPGIFDFWGATRQNKKCNGYNL